MLGKCYLHMCQYVHLLEAFLYGGRELLIMFCDSFLQIVAGFSYIFISAASAFHYVNHGFNITWRFHVFWNSSRH